MDKDRAIITQVAAKIASDLVNKEADTDTKLGEFTTLFTSVKDIMFEIIDGSQDAQIYEMAKSTFNATTVSSNSENGSQGREIGSLQIIGKQHGDLPDWLIKACKRDGVTKVYDNRDGLSVNPKRPWFKADDADKAYWAPKTR